LFNASKPDIKYLVISLAILIFISIYAFTQNKSKDPDFTRYFDERGISGTFVLFDPDYGRYYVHNHEWAEERFIPASTFKILHSLIALEAGVIADTSTTLPWDGEQREIRSWNRDHSMAIAFRNSVVWYYRETARRIGEHRMREYVTCTRYGKEI
jgi:beta-lactamase class D